MFYDVADLSNKRDVGSQPGTQWLLSSQKVGNGLAQLRDESLNALWQSDGQQPHAVNIQFAKRTPVTHVSIFLDYTLDDSYTATKIMIKAGTHYHDLQEVRTREFTEPRGWKSFLLDKSDPTISEEDDPTARSDKPPQPPIYVNMLQICILANHLNGKDTHVRGIKVFSPKELSTLTFEDEISEKIGFGSKIGGTDRENRTGVTLGMRDGKIQKEGEELARIRALGAFEDPKDFGGMRIKTEKVDGDVWMGTVFDSEEEEETEDEEERERIGGKREGEEELRNFGRLLPPLSGTFGGGGFGLR